MTIDHVTLLNQCHALAAHSYFLFLIIHAHSFYPLALIVNVFVGIENENLFYWNVKNIPQRQYYYKQQQKNHDNNFEKKKSVYIIMYKKYVIKGVRGYSY